MQHFNQQRQHAPPSALASTRQTLFEEVAWLSSVVEELQLAPSQLAKVYGLHQEHHHQYNTDQCDYYGDAARAPPLGPPLSSSPLPNCLVYHREVADRMRFFTAAVKGTLEDYRMLKGREAREADAFAEAVAAQHQNDEDGEGQHSLRSPLSNQQRNDCALLQELLLDATPNPFALSGLSLAAQLAALTVQHMRINSAPLKRCVARNVGRSVHDRSMLESIQHSVAAESGDVHPISSNGGGGGKTANSSSLFYSKQQQQQQKRGLLGPEFESVLMSPSQYYSPSRRSNSNSAAAATNNTTSGSLAATAARGNNYYVPNIISDVHRRLMCPLESLFPVVAGGANHHHTLPSSDPSPLSSAFIMGTTSSSSAGHEQQRGATTSLPAPVKAATSLTVVLEESLTYLRDLLAVVADAIRQQNNIGAAGGNNNDDVDGTHPSNSNGNASSSSAAALADHLSKALAKAGLVEALVEIIADQSALGGAVGDLVLMPSLNRNNSSNNAVTQRRVGGGGLFAMSVNEIILAREAAERSGGGGDATNEANSDDEEDDDTERKSTAAFSQPPSYQALVDEATLCPRTHAYVVINHKPTKERLRALAAAVLSSMANIVGLTNSNRTFVLANLFTKYTLSKEEHHHGAGGGSSSSAKQHARPSHYAIDLEENSVVKKALLSTLYGLVAADCDFFVQLSAGAIPATVNGLLNGCAASAPTTTHASHRGHHFLPAEPLPVMLFKALKGLLRSCAASAISSSSSVPSHHHTHRQDSASFTGILDALRTFVGNKQQQQQQQQLSSSLTFLRDQRELEQTIATQSAELFDSLESLCCVAKMLTMLINKVAAMPPSAASLTSLSSPSSSPPSVIGDAHQCFWRFFLQDVPEVVKLLLLTANTANQLLMQTTAAGMSTTLLRQFEEEEEGISEKLCVVKVSITNFLRRVDAIAVAVMDNSLSLYSATATFYSAFATSQNAKLAAAAVEAEAAVPLAGGRKQTGGAGDMVTTPRRSMGSGGGGAATPAGFVGSVNRRLLNSSNATGAPTDASSLLVNDVSSVSLSGGGGGGLFSATGASNIKATAAVTALNSLAAQLAPMVGSPAVFFRALGDALYHEHVVMCLKRSPASYDEDEEGGADTIDGVSSGRGESSGMNGVAPLVSMFRLGKIKAMAFSFSSGEGGGASYSAVDGLSVIVKAARTLRHMAEHSPPPTISPPSQRSAASANRYSKNSSNIPAALVACEEVVSVLLAALEPIDAIYEDYAMMVGDKNDGNGHQTMMALTKTANLKKKKNNRRSDVHFLSPRQLQQLAARRQRRISAQIALIQAEVSIAVGVALLRSPLSRRALLTFMADRVPDDLRRVLAVGSGGASSYDDDQSYYGGGGRRGGGPSSTSYSSSSGATQLLVCPLTQQRLLQLMQHPATAASAGGLHHEHTTNGSSSSIVAEILSWLRVALGRCAPSTSSPSHSSSSLFAGLLVQDDMGRCLNDPFNFPEGWTMDETLAHTLHHGGGGGGGSGLSANASTALFHTAQTSVPTMATGLATSGSGSAMMMRGDSSPSRGGANAPIAGGILPPVTAALFPIRYPTAVIFDVRFVPSMAALGAIIDGQEMAKGSYQLTTTTNVTQMGASSNGGGSPFADLGFWSCVVEPLRRACRQSIAEFNNRGGHTHANNKQWRSLGDEGEEAGGVELSQHAQHQRGVAMRGDGSRTTAASFSHPPMPNPSAAPRHYAAAIVYGDLALMLIRHVLDRMASTAIVGGDHDHDGSSSPALPSVATNKNSGHHQRMTAAATASNDDANPLQRVRGLSDADVTANGLPLGFAPPITASSLLSVNGNNRNRRQKPNTADDGGTAPYMTATDGTDEDDGDEDAMLMAFALQQQQQAANGAAASMTMMSSPYYNDRGLPVNKKAMMGTHIGADGATQRRLLYGGGGGGNVNAPADSYQEHRRALAAQQQSQQQQQQVATGMSMTPRGARGGGPAAPQPPPLDPAAQLLKSEFDAAFKLTTSLSEHYHQRLRERAAGEKVRKSPYAAALMGGGSSAHRVATVNVMNTSSTGLISQQKRHVFVKPTGARVKGDLVVGYNAGGRFFDPLLLTDEHAQQVEANLRAWTLSVVQEGDIFFINIPLSALNTTVIEAIIVKARRHQLDMKRQLLTTPITASATLVAPSAGPTVSGGGGGGSTTTTLPQQRQRRWFLLDMQQCVMPKLIALLQKLQHLCERHSEQHVQMALSVLPCVCRTAGGGANGPLREPCVNAGNLIQTVDFLTQYFGKNHNSNSQQYGSGYGGQQQQYLMGGVAGSPYAGYPSPHSQSLMMMSGGQGGTDAGSESNYGGGGHTNNNPDTNSPMMTSNMSFGGMGMLATGGGGAKTNSANTAAAAATRARGESLHQANAAEMDAMLIGESTVSRVPAKALATSGGSGGGMGGMGMGMGGMFPSNVSFAGAGGGGGGASDGIGPLGNFSFAVNGGISANGDAAGTRDDYQFGPASAERVGNSDGGGNNNNYASYGNRNSSATPSVIGGGGGVNGGYDAPLSSTAIHHHNHHHGAVALGRPRATSAGPVINVGGMWASGGGLRGAGGGAATSTLPPRRN